MGVENVEEVQYNEGSNTLTVTFKGGSVIDYHPVNSEIYASILAGDCLYRAIHKVTRSGQIVGLRRKEGN
jgi:GH43 family beta-xylosidase